jgi:hypothetical protein
LVIAANPALLAGSIGPFTGQLDDGGETLRLKNLNGRIMDEVSYEDEGDWPVGADGSGATVARMTEIRDEPLVALSGASPLLMSGAS